MEHIQPGSRGVVRLNIRGSRSRNGTGREAVSISSQQWSLPVQQAFPTPRFSLEEIITPAGPSICTQPAPPTKPCSARLRPGLYPCDNAEAGSSVDADIVAAQTFLRKHHPDIDIPAHLLSELIYDNANALQDTAHDLDGSMGIAEAQAIAFLGPVAFEHMRVYAVVCVGGDNNNCLLLHQLQVHTSTGESVSLKRAQSTKSQAKGKSRATDSSRLIFVPAHSAEQLFRTPILQIVASADKKLLAVRTHTSTIFYSLQHRDGADGSPWLQLKPVYQAHYGSDEIAQHQDICFSPTRSALAATVDRHGNIDLYHFSLENNPAQQIDPALDPVAPSSDVATPSASKTKKRQGFLKEPPAPSAAAAASVTIRVKVQRNLVRLSPRATSDVQDDATPQSDLGALPSIHAPYRVLFAPDDGSLFVLNGHALVRVSLQHPVLGPEVETGSNVDTILETGLCLSSFRRVRFYSMALIQADSDHQLLAVCSSDTIFWFDLQEPYQPLFSTEHHRGDDPTLTLTYLPRHNAATETSARTDDDVIMCVLSSKRNQLTSCYVLSSHRQQDSGHDLLRRTLTEDTSVRWTYKLHPTPVLLPIVISPRPRHERTAAPPMFIDAAEILLEDKVSRSILAFQLDQRGALLAHVFRMHAHEDSPAPSHGSVKIEILPPLDSHLYRNDQSLDSRADIDSSSYVKTKNLDYQQLYRSLFAASSTRKADKQRSDAIVDGGHGAARLVADLFNVPSKGQTAVQAATLSLGQLITRLNQDNDVRERVPSSRAPWSNALGLEGDEQAEQKRTKAILDLRDDLRRTLSSLGASSAQGAWSRVGTIASGQNEQGQASSPRDDVLKRALEGSRDDVHAETAPYLPTEKAVQSWTATWRRLFQHSLQKASREMMLDLALESEIFVRPKAGILDEGAPRQRPQQRQGTNWTAFEHRHIYRFVEEQGDVIPPPHVGSVGLSFFTPLRSGDVQAAAAAAAPATSGHEQNGSKRNLDEVELEALLPSTSSTARLLLAEWQLGEDPTEYNYLDPFQGLHRLPRASRMRGSTARARSRSFSRASSVSTEDRSRSHSRSRKQSAAPSLSQSGIFDSQGASSSYPPSLVAASRADSVSASPAPPTLVSRRKQQREAISSQPNRAPSQVYHPADTLRHSLRVPQTSSAAQSQPAALPRFGLAGSFADLTPIVSPPSSQVGTPTLAHLGAASTQIEAGRFGARPVRADRPPKKKKRASGF
ncbi:hypothetical protein EX895_003754 [Sporisorium graminicola]|uniref:RRN6 K-rich C-terminal domain-containing protein n=1 Tax=Sporisorium graminicola TaxID=280036 RepID=A0A4U7KSS5_9BASI|nr:hypothetical protein EX895_003754 [Sporisorium graminicola]TKY87077.1 hypothetical protein EX895_003754 [Sporisorium graminicola]